MSERGWETAVMTVRPEFANIRNVSITDNDVAASNPDVGSSKKINPGLVIKTYNMLDLYENI